MENLDERLRQALPGFEPRPGQRTMMSAVEEALLRGDDVVVEAGTGTGKTLAYLVPILRSGRRAVLSTATRQLQRQIHEHDLPVAAQVTGTTPDAVVLKGRRNYLCRQRLDAAIARRAKDGWPLGKGLTAADHLARTDDVGDVADLPDLPEDDPVWPDLVSTADNCLGADCSFYDECFVVRARRRALNADVVIVNHHLLLADFAVREQWDGAMLLPGAEILAIDEAHALPDVASHFFGASISDRRISRLAADLAELAGALGPEADDLAEHARDLDRRGRLLAAAAAGLPDKSVLDKRARATLEAPRDGLFLALDRVFSALSPARAATSPLVNTARGAVEAIRNDAALVLRPESDADEQVRWVEQRTRTTAFVARPADTAPILQRTLLAEPAARIFTSATLSLAGDFTAFRRSVGLDPDVRALCVEGAFDYANQALLYVPRHLPMPFEDGRDSAVAVEIKRLCLTSKGGAFALFTSYRGMRSAFARLDGRLPMTTMMQGQGSREALLARFRNEQPAVLFATMGFWQGVDLPGDVLRLVILDKIPFPPPDDPLLAARGKRLEAEGRSSFVDISMPAAATALRQGFGRLIRHREDRGVVAILDSRLVRRSYGRQLLKSLPPAPVTPAFAAVETFFGG